MSILSAKQKQQFKLNIHWYAIYSFVIRDVDEMTSEASLSEEKAQRAMIDAARLADEVRIFFLNLHLLISVLSSAWNKSAPSSWRGTRSFSKPRSTSLFIFFYHLSFHHQVGDIICYF